MQTMTGLPVVMAAAAMVMDLRRARVDNGWILFCYVCGLAARLFTDGPQGIFAFFSGIFLPILLFGWLFVFHMLGAGDIKLLSALGGVMGAGRILKCMFASVLIGAGISAAILISTGSVRQRFRYFWDYISNFAASGERKPYFRKEVNVPENFHFTVPIFLSVLLYAGGVY